MVIEYRDGTTLRTRVFVAVVVIPFMVVSALVFTSVLGLFGSDALDLIRSILRGDFTNLGDFVGYLALLLLGVGLPCVFIYVSISKGVLGPDIVVTIDPDRQIVSIDRDRPWQSSCHAEYAFSEVDAVELANSSRTASDKNEISLRIRGLKRPLVLATIFDAQAAAREFAKLRDMGLPSR